MGRKNEPAIQAGDDGQRMLYFDSCQLNWRVFE